MEKVFLISGQGNGTITDKLIVRRGRGTRIIVIFRFSGTVLRAERSEYAHYSFWREKIST